MELEAEVARLRAELDRVRAEAREAVESPTVSTGASWCPVARWWCPRPPGRAPPAVPGTQTEEVPMAIDPNRWTIKTQEAFAAAVERARPPITPRSPPTTCWPPSSPSPTARRSRS
jgi:hypothetical protein